MLIHSFSGPISISVYINVGSLWAPVWYNTTVLTILLGDRKFDYW